MTRRHALSGDTLTPIACIDRDAAWGDTPGSASRFLASLVARCYSGSPMLDLYAELRRLAEALDAAGVTYALAGGLAVSIYTTPRATEDIDLLIGAADLEHALAALRPLGFRAPGAPMSVAEGRLQVQRLLKIEGTDLLPLDLLVPRDPALGSLLQDRVAVGVEGRAVWVVGVAALRSLKRLRGSARDRADLEALGPE